MTYTRPVFYYANGTTYIADFFGLPLVNLFPGGSSFSVKGLNGANYSWTGALIEDPFPMILDQSLWSYRRVPYGASILNIGYSIQYGIDWVVNQILATPRGTPFGLGGYSQGAAVMMGVYSECRQGRLVDRRHDLRGVVTFGSPVREANHTFKGSSGYNGAFDVTGQLTGAHGCFPNRIQNTEDFVYDFVMPNDVITGVGDSAIGQSFVREAGLLLSGVIGAGIALIDILISTGLFGVAQALGAAAADINVVDALGNPITLGGGGHVAYPFWPPPNADGSIPSSGDTCYQLAAKYINRIGQQIYDELNPTPPTSTIPPSFVWSSTW